MYWGGVFCHHSLLRKNLQCIVFSFIFQEEETEAVSVLWNILYILIKVLSGYLTLRWVLYIIISLALHNSPANYLGFLIATFPEDATGAQGS